MIATIYGYTIDFFTTQGASQYTRADRTSSAQTGLMRCVSGVVSWGSGEGAFIVSVAKILVSRRIVTKNLPIGDGFDLTASADNLADLEGRILSEALAEDFTGAEIYVDIAIFSDALGGVPLEINMFNEKEQQIHQDFSPLLERLNVLLAEKTADLGWAVKA